MKYHIYGIFVLVAGDRNTMSHIISLSHPIGQHLSTASCYSENATRPVRAVSSTRSFRALKHEWSAQPRHRWHRNANDLCPKWSSKSNDDPRHLFTMRSSWLAKDDMSHLGMSAGVTVGLLHNVEISRWRMSQCVLVSAIVRLLLGEASAGLLTQTLHDFTSDLWKSVPFNPSLTPCRPWDVKTTFSAFITSRRRAASSARSFSLSWLSWNGWRQSEYAMSGNVGNCRDMTWYLWECIKIYGDTWKCHT